jgi:hypothetical protein
MNYQIMAILVGAIFVVISQWDKVSNDLEGPLRVLIIVTLIGVFSLTGS